QARAPAVGQLVSVAVDDRCCEMVRTILNAPGIDAGECDKLMALLADHDANDSYLMSGLYGLPWGLYLPEEGDPVWYLSMGNVMFSSSLWNIERNDDGFSFESTMVTQGGGGISMRVEAKVDATGAVTGMVHLGEMERAAEPEGNQVMSMPLTGRRLGLEKVASAD
ncbi:MAG: hypothetical protein AAB353_13785, partial [Candidatus Hydrogenedentota bacterium]